jgi:hypothetical protein
MKKFLATLALLAACSAPAFAADGGHLDVIGLAPVGNVPNHNVDYGLSYSVAKVGPVRFSPLADIAPQDGPALVHFGASATVNVLKHFDVGVAEVQRPGGTGFDRMGTSAILGVRI